MPSYNRSNAIPNVGITLRTLFKRFNAPIDPYSWGPVLITKKDPRDITYNSAIDLLETIPFGGISHVGVGIFDYTTANTTITAVGTYYDVFTFKFEAGGQDFLVVNTFQVTATGVPKLGYVTVQELRDEGLTDTVAYPDALVNSRISLASRQIDSWTGRWFEPRKMIMDVDGPGAWEMQIDIPIVSIDLVTLLDREFPVTEVFTFDLQDMVVYNRHITQNLYRPDDREDPRIGNIYFPKGRMNVRLDGTFGYTDGNGDTPEEIKRACMLMVIRDKEKLASKKRSSSLLVGLGGPLLEENTDDHSYKLGAVTRTVGSTAYFTGDPEIDQILLNFRRPAALGKGLGASITGRDLGADWDRYKAGFDFYFGRSV